MACRGCSQVGDCACNVVGGNGVTVSGTGSALDPFTVTIDDADFANDWPDATPDLCTTNTKVLAQLENNTLAWIPAPKPCARIV